MQTVIDGAIKCYVFLDVDEMLHAITCDKTGANLPTPRGRWRFQMIVAVGSGRPMPAGIDLNRALQSLHKIGYLIWPASDIHLLSVAAQQISKRLCAHSFTRKTVLLEAGTKAPSASAKLREWYLATIFVGSALIRPISRRSRLGLWPLLLRCQRSFHALPTIMLEKDIVFLSETAAKLCNLRRNLSVGLLRRG